MIGWRLCRRIFADLEGEGAFRYGGRWNSRGKHVVYLAEHPALAALEVRVHLDLPFELLPSDFVLMRVAVPDTSIADVALCEDTVLCGDTWLREMRSPTMRVASILVPHSWNILFNPRYMFATAAEIQSIEPFDFDPRLWHPLSHEG
jgi:RES domain-containing protein